MSHRTTGKSLHALLALLLVAAGAMAVPDAYAGGRDKAVTVAKVATLAPDGTAWMKAMRTMVKHVEEASGGRFHARFYTGGVLGDEPDVVRKMKLGQLDGSGVSLTGVRLTCPEFQVMELPFLFGDRAFDETEYVFDKLGHKFEAYAEQRGYKLIALASAGFAHICSKEPLDNILQDLPRMKVWQWEGEEVMKEISRSLSVPTISLPLPDTLTALQTGMINAFYGTPMHILAFQWSKYVNYLYRPSIFYTPSFVVVTKRAWNKMPADIQALFYDEQAEQIKRDSLRRIHESDNESLEVLKKAGLQVVEIPPDQMVEIRKRTRAVWDDLKGNLFPAELLDEVLALIQEKRQGKAPSAASAGQP